MSFEAALVALAVKVLLLALLAFLTLAFAFLVFAFVSLAFGFGFSIALLLLVVILFLLRKLEGTHVHGIVVVLLAEILLVPVSHNKLADPLGRYSSQLPR